MTREGRMKKTIFIASANEAREIAEKVAQALG
jgi:hypothetical protein